MRIVLFLRFFLRIVFVSFILIPTMKTKGQQKQRTVPSGREKKRIVATLTSTDLTPGATVDLRTGAIEGLAPGAVSRVEHFANPPVHLLLEEAEGEPTRVELPKYMEVIEVLREKKGFSFREIAEWLAKRGVDADHNAVYRLYTKKVVGEDPEGN